MSKILITGALGHIGSKLIHDIKQNEFEDIYLIDNLLTQRYSSLFNLPAGNNFHFIEADICAAEINKYFKNIDIVIHLAAITDAASSAGKPDEVLKVNLFGTERVAEACIENNCKLFFPSTTSVYGMQEEIVDEDCPIENLKPQSPYAESKLKTEQLLDNLGIEKGLRYVICRFGTIYGTSIGMRFHTAVNKFCWQAVMGQPLTIWRTALNQKRPYLDLEDAVNVIRFIIKEDLFEKKINNVVTTNKTVEELVNIIKTFLNDVSIKYVDSKIMNQLSYNVLSDRIREKGFTFNGNLEKGIENTINILKNSNGRFN